MLCSNSHHKHLLSFLSANMMESPGEEGVRAMNEFESTLRDKISEAERTLSEAQQAGHDYEIHLHVARIRDLLDLAERHGIDTSGWVSPTMLVSSAL